MNKQAFFAAIRQFINTNATEPRAGFVANNLTLITSGFDLSIEGRSAGNGYVTISRDYVLIADECSLHPLFSEDGCRAAALAVLEAQEELKAEELGRIFADEPPLRADILSDHRAEGFRTTLSAAGLRLIRRMIGGVRFEGAQPK